MNYIQPGSRWTAAVRRHWLWISGLTLACLLGGFYGGYRAGFYTAAVELLPPAAGTSRTNVSLSSLAGLAHSDYVLQRVLRSAAPGFDAETLAGRVTTATAAGLVRVDVKGRDATATVQLANIFGDELAGAAQAVLEEQQQSMRRELTQRLASVDQQLDLLTVQLAGFQERTLGMDFEAGWALPFRRRVEVEQRIQDVRGQLEVCELQIQSLTREISKLTPALVAAKEALTQALMQYTEDHPKVKVLRSTIESLASQATSPATSADPGVEVINSPAVVNLFTRLTELKGQRAALTQSLEGALLQGPQLSHQIDTLPENQAEQVRLVSNFKALKEERFALAQRFQETQQAKESERMRMVSRAGPETLARSGKWTTALKSSAGCALAGLLGALLIALVLPPGRILTEHDLVDATGLPLLASLGDLEDMTETERQQWSFQMFTSLWGRFTKTNQDTLVIGFTSAGHAEGRSTWVRLLADAAGRLGFQVLKVSAVCRHERVPPEEARPLPLKDTTQLALSEHVQHEMAHLPATVAWNSEYRDQWGLAVAGWHNVQRLVVLVELPPASQPETFLLADALPNVVWLCHQGAATSTETRVHLETLHHARANLVGCVLNRVARRRRRQPHGPAMAALALLLSASAVPAQEAESSAASAAKESSQETLFVSAPNRLAHWQKKLTLGPGDLFDISLFDQPESLRAHLGIGPDGRINYLEARDVLAAGLTVDELRTKLEDILAKFHRVPRVVISPLSFGSKKYYMLGDVNQKGVFTLDRPVSLIEAIAKAGGFVTTVQNRNSWIQADLARSFLVRRGTNSVFARVPVDFEGLFLHGDLSQNFSMAPDDYLFFPSLELQEVYVLGEVMARGVLPYTPGMTVIQAIGARGGFTSRAFKSRVLVVRGSLNRPQTVVLDVGDIAKGKALNFQLKNRDIIYVHEKPWARAQELLEQAIIAFVDTAVVAYAGQHIGPLIEEPFIE